MALNIKFVEAFNGFIAKVEGLMDSHYSKEFPSLPKPIIGYDEGSKYIRVWKGERHSSGKISKYAYCFVDKSNGDVLKCAGWKAPAKKARGNIYSPKGGLEGVNPYGANYL